MGNSCCASSDERKQDSARLKEEQSLQFASMQTMQIENQTTLGSSTSQNAQLDIADVSMKEVQEDGTEKENPLSARGQASESGKKQEDNDDEEDVQPSNDAEPESEPQDPQKSTSVVEQELMEQALESQMLEHQEVVADEKDLPVRPHRLSNVGETSGVEQAPSELPPIQTDQEEVKQEENNEEEESKVEVVEPASTKSAGQDSADVIDTEQENPGLENMIEGAEDATTEAATDAGTEEQESAVNSSQTATTPKGATNKRNKKNKKKGRR